MCLLITWKQDDEHRYSNNVIIVSGRWWKAPGRRTLPAPRRPRFLRTERRFGWRWVMLVARGHRVGRQRVVVGEKDDGVGGGTYWSREVLRNGSTRSPPPVKRYMRCIPRWNPTDTHTQWYTTNIRNSPNRYPSYPPPHTTTITRSSTLIE